MNQNIQPLEPGWDHEAEPDGAHGVTRPTNADMDEDQGEPATWADVRPRDWNPIAWIVCTLFWTCVWLVDTIGDAVRHYWIEHSLRHVCMDCKRTMGWQWCKPHYAGESHGLCDRCYYARIEQIPVRIIKAEKEACQGGGR
jgi:hypothetical protein